MSKHKILSTYYSFLFLSLVGQAPNSFGANTLDIEFSGQLISTMCQLTSDSLNQEIKLENIRWQTINEEGISDTTAFSLRIEKCSATDLNKVVKLIWQSNQLVTINGNSFLTTTGNSKVVLGLVDMKNNPVIWNKSMSIGSVTIAENMQEFNFGVYVRKPAQGNANAGDFSGIVNFTLEYE